MRIFLFFIYLERLGYRGSEDIMKHPWFSKVDWIAIQNKQVIPPFVPIISSDSDTQNFDPVK